MTVAAAVAGPGVDGRARAGLAGVSGAVDERPGARPGERPGGLVGGDEASWLEKDEVRAVQEAPAEARSGEDAGRLVTRVIEERWKIARRSTERYMALGWCGERQTKLVRPDQDCVGPLGCENGQRQTFYMLKGRKCWSEYYVLELNGRHGGMKESRQGAIG